VVRYEQSRPFNAAAKENNLSDILRDFKKFTSKQIITAIQNNELSILSHLPTVIVAFALKSQDITG